MNDDVSDGRPVERLPSMNARQANTEARKRLGAGARISVTPDCGGQMMLVGRKTTNGCGCPGHLQPCPGGVPIYSLERTYVSPELGRMRVGEARGASYEDVLARYDAMRAAERERFAAFRKAGTKPARSSRKGHP